MDVISINRYYGWYVSPGNLDTISTDLSADLEAWYSLHNKPIIITEYGAGAIAGTHEVGLKIQMPLRHVAVEKEKFSI